MSEMMIFWLILLILCIIIEAFTLGLTSIWFAGGALIAIFATLLHAPIFVQIILFFLVSLLMLFFTRPLAVRYFNGDRIKTNVESMVGRQAIVTGDIDNLQGTGQVTVTGQEWSARSWDDGCRIPAGAVVNVVAISGVKLIVRTDGRLAEQRKPELDIAVPPSEQGKPELEAAVPPSEQGKPELEAAVPPVNQAEPGTDAAMPQEEVESQTQETGLHID